MSKDLDPNRTIVVVKHDGREVGRTAATNPHLTEYIALVANGRPVTVDHEEDTFGLMNLFIKPR